MSRRKALKKHFKWILPLAAVLILAAIFFVYTGIFYHAVAAEDFRKNVVEFVIRNKR